MRGNAFRTFVHPPGALETIAMRDGFRRIQRSQTVVWSIDLYARMVRFDAVGLRPTAIERESYGATPTTGPTAESSALAGGTARTPHHVR